MRSQQDTLHTEESDAILAELGLPAPFAPEVSNGVQSLSADIAVRILHTMIRTRVLEERTIKMSKSGEAYFWVGGPGEEAFNVCLGMQILKGRGPAFDYLHLHYRNLGLMLAMGMSMTDHLRQMAMRITDPHSNGRNFVCHYAKPEWNVVPVTSVIEVQYVMAPGTAIMQKRHGGQGVTVVVGGDAGTAEGDFTSCLIWATRPGQELPVLIIVTNNGYGISTPAHQQHSERRISERGKVFGIPGETIDGNDPIACRHALERAFAYCRYERRPFLLEAMVSRLHGHSSSSGAMRVTTETDCLDVFERRLLAAGIIDEQALETLHRAAWAEANAAVEQVMQEPQPTAADVERHTYAPSPVDVIYPLDYTGLPH